MSRHVVFDCDGCGVVGLSEINELNILTEPFEEVDLCNKCASKALVMIFDKLGYREKVIQPKIKPFPLLTGIRFFDIV